MRWPKLEDDGQGDEPSRADVPLHLLAEFSSASLDRWQPVILDEERRCFSLHWPKAIPEGLSRSYFQRLLDVAPWVELRNTKGTSVTRSTCWYATGGCTCDYTYGQQTRVTNASTLQPAAEGVEKVEPSENTQFIHGSVEVEPLSEGSLSSFRSVMEEILEYVFGKLFPGLSREAWPNSANLNLYRDGRQGVGWHADDELLFKGKDSDCPVVSISLGAAREFWIALKDGTAGDPPRRSGALNLENFPNCFHTPKGQELLNRLPRKAKYVSCPPGSVEFLAQEMPDDIPNEDPRGDGSPLLNAVEKEHFKGSDFFDPDVVLDRFLKEVKRAVDIRKIRYDKRKEEEKQAALEKDSEPAEPEKPLVTEWHTAGAEMPAGILDTDADWAVPAAAAPELDVPIKTDEGEIADAELDLPAEPVLPVPEWNSDIPVKTEQGEIDDAELGLPPEPVLPTPDWNSDPAKTTQGEISDVELSLPPEPILPAPEWNSDVPVKTDQGEIDDAELGLPPEPILPTPEWNRDVPVRKGRGLPQGGALMNLSDEDFDIPPPPQLLSPPARPKTGSDVPRLPLVTQHAHEPQALLPEVHANVPHDLDDPRYWTYERYQREKSRARMCSSCCSCETFKESQCKLVLLALLLVALSVLALGMSGSLKDRLMIEATYALSGVFFFLGCISCCKACCVTQSAEAVESQLNHPDAMIGRPLIGDYSESSELPV